MPNDYLPPVFEIQFAARLTPSHPKYFELGVCIVSIWLFSKSEDDAVERAKMIITQLPYEVASKIGKARQSAPEGNVERNMLNQIGIAFLINALVVEGDGEQLIKAWEKYGLDDDRIG